MVNVDIDPPTYQQATKEVQQIIETENIYPELNEKGKQESPKNFSKLERKHLCLAGKRERIEAKLAWKKHKLEHKLNKIHEMKTIEPSKKSIQIVEDGKVIQEFGGVDSGENSEKPPILLSA
ncbi:unnamed protein product, partial [Mesorhabditis belari]|uniref:Uncharacterized protein n=1 Tax=Mesorhabditis belari TaxID=2138241 RepID=A0AAF3FPX2_9BILA